MGSYNISPWAGVREMSDPARSSLQFTTPGGRLGSTSLLWDGVCEEKRPVMPDHRQRVLWSSHAVEEESVSSRKTLLSSYGPLPDLSCFDTVIINEEIVQINKARITETLDRALPPLPAKMEELSSDLKELNDRPFPKFSK